MSINLVTGREFEPLHPEYAAVNPTHNGDSSKTYTVVWYDANNEMHEEVKASRELAAQMAADYNGTYTVRES